MHLKKNHVLYGLWHANIYACVTMEKSRWLRDHTALEGPGGH